MILAECGSEVCFFLHVTCFGAAFHMICWLRFRTN